MQVPVQQMAYQPNVPYMQQQYPDPIQQYVSNSPYDYIPTEQEGEETDEAEPTNEVSTVIDPYSGYANAGGYNPAAYSPDAFNPNQYNPGAFHVQTGYQGYLVPGPPGAPAKQQIATSEPPSFLTPISNAISSLMPSAVRDGSGTLLSRSFAFLMSLLGVTVFGGAVTTALCTFTPLCTISFALPFIRNALPLNSKLYQSELEPILGKPGYELLAKAIDRYTKFNDEKKEKISKSVSNSVSEADTLKPIDASKAVIEKGVVEPGVEAKVEPVEKSDTVRSVIPTVKGDIPNSKSDIPVDTNSSSDKWNVIVMKEG